MRLLSSASFFFFFNDTATTEIYTLSLHDALPISGFYGRDPWRAPQIHDLHRRQRARPHAIRQRDGDEPLVSERLDRGCRAPENKASSFELRAHRGGVASVVARGRALLVAGLVLLVHHDRAKPLDGREHGGAGPDRGAPLAPAQRAPRIGALAIGQSRGQHGHAG